MKVAVRITRIFSSFKTKKTHNNWLASGYDIKMENLLSIKEASEWATEYLGKTVTTSNISYLIQYGRIRKFGNNGTILISKQELEEYYKSYNSRRETSWKTQLGEDLNWALSFDQYKEAETTKHVHRLHPYKGKFIPQLVEYFLDTHIDTFKKQTYFKKGDIILDPFCGSGTTLVQSCELGIHAVGIDISAFNALISNCKLLKYNLPDVQIEINRITGLLQQLIYGSHIVKFEENLMKELYEFNNRNFPVPEYKYKVKRGEIDEKTYGKEKEEEFLFIFNRLVKEYHIELNADKTGNDSFLNKWYSLNIRNEIQFVFDEIRKIKDTDTKKILAIILSRTVRSCRATTHADLTTLKKNLSSPHITVQNMVKSANRFFPF
ncbi:MAG: DNA methyltransferase [Desulfobacterales bacterium]